MASQNDFLVELDGVVDGSTSSIEVRELPLEGKLTPQTRVALARGEAKLHWVPARKPSGLFNAAGNALPHPPANASLPRTASCRLCRRLVSVG